MMLEERFSANKTHSIKQTFTTDRGPCRPALITDNDRDRVISVTTHAISGGPDRNTPCPAKRPGAVRKNQPVLYIGDAPRTVNVTVYSEHNGRRPDAWNSGTVAGPMCEWSLVALRRKTRARLRQRFVSVVGDFDGLLIREGCIVKMR